LEIKEQKMIFFLTLEGSKLGADRGSFFDAD